MESEEVPLEAEVETDKIRLEMNAEFERWKASVQEEQVAHATSICQLETKLTELKGKMQRSKNK